MELIQIFAFNIFTRSTSIISYKMLNITWIYNEKANELTIYHVRSIMPKHHNILSTRTSFFISSAGEIESVQEFKTFQVAVS